ncbi:DUF2785 domain-containing protein [Lactobacillus sp. M0403]|uniref:DUF2785 domain-containing protein n=1 Tax=Lactobacillus sp. M0403 TaxID=2751031 RepID=UPI0018DE1D64|nr:DUF2785 domain-containing protein [Lactobacillus sp. M0403]MBI0092154.1 DUF2785 domain-containing protein [Lactobacillus sp. M0403]
MQNELEQLVALPEGKLVFTNEQIQFLLDNIGNLNPHIRDNLVYTLFARGFSENAFNQKQIQVIIDSFIQNRDLFRQINQPENDAVFLRTFSALLGALILESDNDKPILTDSDRQLLFDWSIRYLKEEKDFRGYVTNKGWAHSVAHGSDFLGATLNHHDFKPKSVSAIFEVITSIFQNLKNPFVDDEEQRIAFAFFQGVHFQKIASADFNSFVDDFDKKIYQQLLHDDRVDWYCFSSWFRLLQNWYFYFSTNKEVQDNLLSKITAYNEKMGFAL